MKAILLMFWLSFTSASDQNVKNTNTFIKNGINTKIVKNNTNPTRDITDVARLTEYKIIMEYINDARKSSGYEN